MPISSASGTVLEGRKVLLCKETAKEKLRGLNQIKPASISALKTLVSYKVTVIT